MDLLMEPEASTVTAVLHSTAWHRTPDDLPLFTQRWRPDGPLRSVVIFVHGYAEHSGRYAHLGTTLAARGHAVFTYDQRGYGRSGGRRAYVDAFYTYVKDLARFIAATRRDAGEGMPLFLLGHSMGGAVCTRYCFDHPHAVDGLMLSSPALRLGSATPALPRALSDFIGRYFPSLPTIRLDRRLISRDADVVAQAERDPLNYKGRMPARTGAELLKATHDIQERMEALTLPLLLIHGTADRLTDPAGSKALYARARSTDKTLGLYDGLYHETMNEPEHHLIFDALLGWLDEHTGGA
jgi:acylglycerol lipase